MIYVLAALLPPLGLLLNGQPFSAIFNLGSRDAVVDTFGAVYGVEKPRVIDASIMPDLPSAPTNLTTIMLAEHIYKRALVS